jgi:hypothetical protein
MRNAPEPGWLFLYLLGALPFGIMVLNASQGVPPEPRSVQGYSWTEPGQPFSWPGTLVGLVLITYYWWPAWIQRARYGRPKKRVPFRKWPEHEDHTKRRRCPFI